jgi:hypothetical protein
MTLKSLLLKVIATRKEMAEAVKVVNRLASPKGSPNCVSRAQGELTVWSTAAMAHRQIIKVLAEHIDDKRPSEVKNGRWLLKSIQATRRKMLQLIKKHK